MIERLISNGFRRVLLAASALLALSALGPMRASAASYYSGERALTPFIFYAVELRAGRNYTIETRNLTAGGDPVMHLLYWNGSSYVQVAANDDYVAGSRESVIIYKPTVTRVYTVFIHSYNSGSSGRADLWIRGAQHLSQARFGGQRDDLTWTAGQNFRATGSERGKNNDTMLFLLRNTLTFLQMDNNSGPKSYSMLTANTTEGAGARAVWGTYPNTSCNGQLTKHTPGGANADGDLLPDELEALTGSSSVLFDSDNDAISDTLELWGNEGWSYSESSVFPGNNATRRNVYVEVDFMVGGGTNQNKTPYANLAADVATVFAADGNVTADVVVDTSLAWAQDIGWSACTDTGCANFYTLKTANFAPTDLMQRLYFHYAVFADDLDTTMGFVPCTSGVAELLGNDLIVSLSASVCPWGFTPGQQQGTFTHELGHNIALTHNGNDTNNNFSTIHNSVMNYRYQTAGVTGRAGVLAYTYSFGTNGCAACATSPKDFCIQLNGMGLCPGLQGTFCDCDANEWGTINLDFYEGSQADWGDGLSLLAFEDPAATARRTREGLELTLLPESRPVPSEPQSDRRARIARRVQAMRAEGQREGRDFTVSADGLHVYSVCR